MVTKTLNKRLSSNIPIEVNKGLNMTIEPSVLRESRWVFGGAKFD